MDEISSLFFFGALILFVLFGPWIWLIRSRVRQKRERAEDQEHLRRLTDRVFQIESAVRELKRWAEVATTKAPAPTRAEAAVETKVEVPLARPSSPPRSDSIPPAVAAETFIKPIPEQVRKRVEPAPLAEPPRQSSPPAPLIQSSAKPSISLFENFKSAVDIEEMLGTNWLNKIGISLLVLGVAFFLALKLKTLGPGGKVLVGYAIGLFILGAGIWFERLDRYRILARAGVGGGWALTFFVTYAMYHVGAARVLTSQTADLVLMLAVAAAMVWHTLRYKSQVVTGLAFLLAFATVTISHEKVYSLTAGAVLAAALVVIVGRMQWFELEIFGIAASYLNHFLWLQPIIGPMHGKHHMFPEFFASAGILAAYWCIYRSSYVLRTPQDARQESLSTVAAFLNTGSLLALLKYQSVHPEWAFWALLVIGAVETALGQLPITRRRRTAVVVLSTLGSVLLISAFPFRYSGTKLSMLWLIEAEALFLVGVRAREVVFRRVGVLATVVVAGQMVSYDAAHVYGMRSDGAYVRSDFGLATLFMAASAVFYLNAHWIFLRWRDLFTAEFDRVLMHRLSYVACILVFIGAWIAFPEAWTAVAWCALGVLLAALAERLRIPDLGYQGKLLSLAAAIRLLMINLIATTRFLGLTLRLTTIVLVSASLYIVARLKIDDKGRNFALAGKSYGYATLVGGFCTWIASFLLSLLAWYELRPVGVAVAWAMGGLLLLELGIGKRAIALRQQAYVALACSFVRIFFVNLNASGALEEVSPRFYTVIPIALVFFYAYWRLSSLPEGGFERERTLAADLTCYLGTISIASLMRFELEADWIAAAWAALVFVLSALAWRSRRRIFLHQALLLGFGVLFRVTLHNFYERSYFPVSGWDDRRLCVGVAVALLLASLAFAFPLRSKEESSQTGLTRLFQALSWRPEQTLFFIAIGLLTVLLTLETRHGMITLAWGLEALSVFMFALWVGERSFRLTGVALLLLCVGKILIVDVWELHPQDRYLTLIVLGAAILVVSFMYTRYREAIRQYL